jgi:hypothetical protein
MEQQQEEIQQRIESYEFYRTLNRTGNNNIGIIISYVFTDQLGWKVRVNVRIKLEGNKIAFEKVG